MYKLLVSLLITSGMMLISCDTKSPKHLSNGRVVSENKDEGNTNVLVDTTGDGKGDIDYFLPAASEVVVGDSVTIVVRDSAVINIFKLTHK